MIGNLILPAAGVAALAYAARWRYQSQRLDLAYFTPGDFGIYWPMMNPGLLRALDDFAGRLGGAVEISPAAGATGRVNTSGQHNVIKWGQVNAVDVMPVGVPLQRAYDIARSMNRFTGIGVYPDWKPRPGLHLDRRDGATVYAPALWGGIATPAGQKYVSIGEVIRA